MNDEDETARLLRLAGPRPGTPEESSLRVRQAVWVEWRAAVRRRAVRRRVIAVTGAFAIAVTAALVLTRTMTPGSRPGRASSPRAEVPVSVARVEGTSELSENARVAWGQWVETGAATRVGLQLPDGTSLRLDRASRARLLSPTAIELAAGTMYLDTRSGSTGLEVRTPLGSLRDIGTQFEVRLGDSSLRVRVRTGVVEVHQGNEAITARSGTELTITHGHAATTSISASGPEWEWVLNLAPVFLVEGRALSSFLEHVAREHGWTLRYQNAELARSASGIVLHGSFDGLSTRDALGAAMGASGLDHRVQQGELIVFRLERE